MVDMDNVKKGFMLGFNNENERKFRIMRIPFLSWMAFGVSFYNLYKLDQQILK